MCYLISCPKVGQSLYFPGETESGRFISVPSTLCPQRIQGALSLMRSKLLLSTYIQDWRVSPERSERGLVLRHHVEWLLRCFVGSCGPGCLAEPREPQLYAFRELSIGLPMAQWWRTGMYQALGPSPCTTIINIRKISQLDQRRFPSKLTSMRTGSMRRVISGQGAESKGQSSAQRSTALVSHAHGTGTLRNRRL